MTRALAVVYLSMRLLLLVLLFYSFFLLLQEKALHLVINCWLFRENLNAYIKQRQQWIPFFSGKVHVSMRNVTESSFELVYSIGEGILDKAAKENQMDISEKLIKIDGVKRVNVVDQKDELSQ